VGAVLALGVNSLTNILYDFLTPVQTTGLQTDVFRSWLGLAFAALILVAMLVAYLAWRGKKTGSLLHYAIPLILSLAKNRIRCRWANYYYCAPLNGRVRMMAHLGDWVKKLYSNTLSF
jgi:hypothetical protein